MAQLQSQGLSRAEFEHDACGLGFVARIDGRPSREIVEQGLTVLGNLAHRGASGADAATGDGAGILVQIPHAFFLRHAGEFLQDPLHGPLPKPGWYGVGTCFLWGDETEAQHCESLLSIIAAQEGQRVLGWRDVPVNPHAIGRTAQQVAPRIRQVIIERTTPDQDSFERKLYVIRRRLHRAVENAFGPKHFYVVSLSSRTLVYKGLLDSTQVAAFYEDLTHPLFTSALALVHSRFSTNTLGSWDLAHPYRFVAHNGEINTLRGNLNWMRARGAQLESTLFGDDMAGLHPVIEPKVNDSAAFDNALEFLYLGGRSLPHAIMTMMPEAWESHHTLDPNRRAFYHYSGALMQPWDGPAAISFTDGRSIGAVLDRNGLRPVRYSRTNDGLVVLASEDGVLPLDPADIVERGRLGPGRMLVVDLERHALRLDDEVKQEVVSTHPYRQWVFDNALGLRDLPPGDLAAPEPLALTQRQRAFGYTAEDVRLLLTPMALNAQEPDGSMGTDTPLAVLSEKPRLLFDYFHQFFAQVTNPPIDSLRERLVMSLRMSVGPEHNLLVDGPHHARRIVLQRPVLTPDELARLRHASDVSFRAADLSLLWPVEGGPHGLEDALTNLCAQAARAVQSGAAVLILSDRGVKKDLVSIPSLLATAAVYHHLVREELSAGAVIVLETGEAREVHHLATLVAFGATAICPYLAFDTIAELADSGGLGVMPVGKATRNYIKALDKGLLKIIAKMGISTLHSYWGSQLFEIVGLSSELVDRHFTGAVCRIGGLDLESVGAEVLRRHRQAFPKIPYAASQNQLDVGGEYQLRQQGAPHQWSEQTIPALQRAVRTGEFSTYEEFARHADEEAAANFTLRSLFAFKSNEESVPIEEVEPVEVIVRRFSTGAMSLGSISKETHEAVAIAMNRIGGKSNTGEGGESADRFSVGTQVSVGTQGDSRRSAIKQVASGRFGVTAHYLVNADIVQIKMAQGSKPGEGGQLPGHKVSEEIAELRHSTPGVGLISPPPHHDIYSIEDLAQLIFDLKMVSGVEVSVKLTSAAGVGTIAAGVVKAKADHLTISGYDGGTGASPLSSIKHAGLPWELGLAETQQVLVANGLRGRVRVQVDGQLKTGRDVVVGALLGAEEFGFSTAPLVTLGCVMMRVCHLNTCPVGIATQDPVLRERFSGKPEHLVRYFFFVAEHVRILMAQLGFRRFEDMIGRVDKLQLKEEGLPAKAKSLDLSPILQPTNGGITSYCEGQEHVVQQSFDARLLPKLESALSTQIPLTLSQAIHNTDRAIGAMISGEIARRYGAQGMEPGTIRLHLSGTAGQSFGAWAVRGLRLDLQGAANDYVGKGLSGGTLTLRPPLNAGYGGDSTIIAGNVALYGATSGEAFMAGTVGERFAVRNSGATAVIEGCGDHGCEYMTGGMVAILGPVGRNFAAGMSGGIAFVYDELRTFYLHCNLDMVGIEVLDIDDEEKLHELLVRHFEATDSTVAEKLLQDWGNTAGKFVKVMPHDYKRVLELQKSLDIHEKEVA